MSALAFSGRITDVDTTQQNPLGLEVEIGAQGSGSPAADKNVGARTYIYVYNDSGATIPVGGVAVRKDAVSTYNVRKSATTVDIPAMVVGVAQTAIPTASYGWLLRKGVGSVIADTGGLTAKVGLIVGNAVAGTADDAAAVTGAVFGYTIVAATATNLATAQFDCRG